MLGALSSTKSACVTEPTDAQGASLGRTGAVVTLKVKVTNTGTKTSDYLWVAVKQDGEPKNPPGSMASDPPNDSVDWFWRRDGDSATEVIIPTTFTLKPGAHDIVRVDAFLDGGSSVGYTVTIYGGPKPNYDRAEADAAKVFKSAPLAVFPSRKTAITKCADTPSSPDATSPPAPEPTRYPYTRLDKVVGRVKDSLFDIAAYLDGVRTCRYAFHDSAWKEVDGHWGMYTPAWENCAWAIGGLRNRGSSDLSWLNSVQADPCYQPLIDGFGRMAGYYAGLTRVYLSTGPRSLADAALVLAVLDIADAGKPLVNEVKGLAQRNFKCA